MTGGSVQARDISQSVVVTGSGNTVTLTFGDSGIVLPLRRRQFRPPDRRRRPAPGDPPRELDLLVPEAGKLPLIGRKDLFAELQAWIDDDVDISVHALIGRAGSGKTRLALEFCLKIDSDPNTKGDWLAGFISPSELAPVVNALATRDFLWERPTLLVVDYAAQCHEALARWLDRLAGQKLDTRLRILLLDREAPDGFGWWRELTGSGLYTARARRELFYAGRPTQLPDLSDLGERRDLMAAALHAARDLRSTPHGGPQIPAAGEDPDFDGTLEKTQFGNPLALVMAGVIALDQGPRAALALRHLEAARRLGRRELDRFAALAQTRRVSGDAMRHIVAFNELVDGFPVADLRRNAADELAASRRSADLDAMLALLQQELPPRPRSEAAASGPRIATIQPDLIGEAAIIDAFSGDPAREAEAKDVVNRAYASAAERAARVLVRLLQDFAYAIEDERAPEQEKTTARRLMDWLLSLSQLPDPEHLIPLVFALPEQTTILREPAAELTQRLAVSFMQEAERSDDPGALATAAALLTNLANRLSDLGRREEALSAAEEGVRLYHSLAASRPDAFTPDLALSLNNLGSRLSDLGRREEALTTIEEAVRLYRALPAARPDAFTPDLARSLNSLGNSLSDLGRREEALTATEEAVRLYRALAASRPDAFTPDLALSLNNLANRLSDLGRRKEALTAAEETERHYRALAATRPDAFTPALAFSLNTLANMLSALGLHEEALTTNEEAVRHHRALAAARPDAFTPDLALSLNTLAIRLSHLGLREEALTAAEEAVRHYRALAAVRPEVFTADLALSFNNLGAMLSALGRREEALTTAEEAVRLRRALAASHPDAFTPNLAASLNNLGIMLSDLGRREEALSAAEEAVRHYRALAACPDAFTPDLARSLNSLGNILGGLGRREEARSVAEEAVRLRRALAASHPDAFGTDLARSLWVLGDLYGETGKFDRAVETLAEAVRLLTPVFVAVPAAVSGMMDGLIESYSKQSKAAGREPDAELLQPVIAQFERIKTEEGKQ